MLGGGVAFLMSEKGLRIETTPFSMCHSCSNTTTKNVHTYLGQFILITFLEGTYAGWT